MMKYFFFFFCKKSLYHFISLFRRLGREHSNAIHDAMNMSVDTHIGHIVEYREDHFCRFDTNPWKCLEEHEVVRNNSPVFICKAYPGLLDIA